MYDSNLDFITVNDRRYPIDLLNPMEAIDWAHRTAALYLPLLGPVLATFDLEAPKETEPATLTLRDLAKRHQPVIAAALGSMSQLKDKEASATMHEAIKRCYTPDNQPLSDMVVFNRHFQDYPEDMLVLGVSAIARLVRDFFPNPVVIAGTGSLTTGMTREHA